MPGVHGDNGSVDWLPRTHRVAVFSLPLGIIGSRALRGADGRPRIIRHWRERRRPVCMRSRHGACARNARRDAGSGAGRGAIRPRQ